MKHKPQNSQNPSGVYWGRGTKGGVGVGQLGTEMEGKGQTGGRCSLKRESLQMLTESLCSHVRHDVAIQHRAL